MVMKGWLRLGKLKIGVICYPSLGGSGVVATELGMMLANRGHELHYITSSKPFRLLDKHPNIHFHEVTIEGYSVFKYPPYDIALANRIAQVIESENLDLLHAHYAMPHAISAALGKDMAESNIGVITTLHGTDVTILGHDPGLRNTVRYGINKSTIVTAVSESLIQDTVKLIEPDKEIKLIYNFIDESKYYPVDAGTLKDDLVLVALFAGLFIGIGLGIIFRYGGTTGGVDILARLAHKYLGWSMGKTMFLFDTLVILASWVTYLNSRSMMYTLVAVFVGARVIDLVQKGAYAARAAFIISQHQDEIATKITNEMGRGVTVFQGYGHFTKSEREILYCVVGQNEIVRLKNIITSIDEYAFVSLTEVHDVMGEGFTLDEQKKPLNP